MPHPLAYQPVEMANAVPAAGSPQTQPRHAEGSVVLRPPAQAEECFSAYPQPTPIMMEVLFDQTCGKGIVPGRHTRVRGEDSRRSHPIQRRTEIDSRLHEFAAALQGHEGSMTLIGMPHGWGDAERPQDADPSNSQQYLLLQPGFLVASVKPGREGAVLWGIFLK